MSIGPIPWLRDGKTVGAVVTFFDITERKKAEETLRKSEQRKRTLLEINNAIINNLTQERFSLRPMKLSVGLSLSIALHSFFTSLKRKP